jgi:hypothetical protein
VVAVLALSIKLGLGLLFKKKKNCHISLLNNSLLEVTNTA